MATAPSTFEPDTSFVASDTYETGEQVSMWQDAWRRLRRNRLAIVGMVIVIVLILVAILSSFWTPYPVWIQSLGPTYQGPTAKHLFGLDDSGRDILSRLMGGAQVSMIVGVGTATLSSIIGIILGLLAGFYRGWIDTILMRFTDLMLTIPTYAAAAAIAYQFGNRGNGWVYLAVILAAFAWMIVARIVRGVFLSLREKEYVEAARALGASNRRIIFRHLLPNAVGPIIVNATLIVAAAILAETALSYIGLGIQPPDTSLGQLVAVGQQAATTRPWLFYFPGLFIIVIVLSINFVGDGLRDAFDPTQTRVRA